MDNDSTTIPRIKATVDSNITKRSDSNHTKKGFTGALYDLGSTHKVLKNSKVTLYACNIKGKTINPENIYQ